MYRLETVLLGRVCDVSPGFHRHFVVRLRESLEVRGKFVQALEFCDFVMEPGLSGFAFVEGAFGWVHGPVVFFP